MARAARIDDNTAGTCDVGIEDCCPHGRNGVTTEASRNVYINGRAAYRRGDHGACLCPHGGTFVSSGGSSTVFINGKRAQRVSDPTVCVACGMDGHITSGSNDVYVGG